MSPCVSSISSIVFVPLDNGTHPVRVVEMHNLALLLVNVLVALSTSTHGECSVHVHVMACKVQTDEELEDHAPPRLCGRKKDQQTSSGTSVSYHVQDSAELGRLIKAARSITVQGIQQAGDAVEEGAATWVKWHVVELSLIHI